MVKGVTEREIGDKGRREGRWGGGVGVAVREKVFLQKYIQITYVGSDLV